MAAPRRSRRPEGEAREALLAAAERLLAERKLDEITVADLLAGAGVSRASFYFYFASKHDVVIALAERFVHEVEIAAGPWLERRELEPEQALREAVRGSLDVWRRHGAVMRAVVESWHASPELGDLWGALTARFTAAAREQVERERAAGIAKADGPDPAALAAALIWMNERVLYLWASEAEPALADPETVVDTLTAIWLRAVYGS